MNNDPIYRPEFDDLLIELNRAAAEVGRKTVLAAIDVYVNELHVYKTLYICGKKWHDVDIHEAFIEFYEKVSRVDIPDKDKKTARALVMGAYYKILIEEQQYAQKGRAA